MQQWGPVRKPVEQAGSGEEQVDGAWARRTGWSPLLYRLPLNLVTWTVSREAGPRPRGAAYTQPRTQR